MKQWSDGLKAQQMWDINLPGLAAVVTGAVTAVVVERTSSIATAEASAIISFVAIIPTRRAPSGHASIAARAPTSVAAKIPTRHVEVEVSFGNSRAN